MEYRGIKYKRYILGNPIKSGGEGAIYEITNDSSLVAKVYNDDKLNRFRDTLKEKIETMLDQPIDPYINGKLCIAWPIDALYDRTRRFVGYVMPRIDASSSIIAGERSDRDQFFKHYNWSYSVAMAYNIALVVSRIHASGNAVGDFNPTNIMLRETGEVVFVDTDSFNIQNKKTGRIYKCTVAVPEMVPPELQGKDWSKETSVFNKETDSFSMAVHIFQLLMDNKHPFNLVLPKNLRSSSSSSGFEKNVTQGRCPYVTGSKWKAETPPSAPDIARLPNYIRELFDRTFDYDATTAVKASTISRRPTADEWVDALGRYYKSLSNTKNQTAVQNSNSSSSQGYYYRHALSRPVQNVSYGSSTGAMRKSPSPTGIRLFKTFLIDSCHSFIKQLNLKKVVKSVIAVITLIILLAVYYRLWKDDERALDSSYESSTVSYVPSQEDEPDTQIIYTGANENDDSRYLSEDYVSQLDKQAIQLEINTIYAHHGYAFRDSNIRNYFLQYDWYSPSISPESFNTNVFSDAEEANIRLLTRYRDR